MSNTTKSERPVMKTSGVNGEINGHAPRKHCDVLK